MKACVRPLELVQAGAPAYPDLAHALVALATEYRFYERNREAEPLYQRAVAIAETAVGPEHPDVARIMTGYALLLAETGRSAEAAELSARIRAIRRDHQREELQAALQLYMRGYGAAFSGQFEEAEPFYQRAIEIQERHPTVASDDLVRTLESYADLLRKTNREHMADSLEARARSILERRELAPVVNPSADDE